MLVSKYVTLTKVILKIVGDNYKNNVGQTITSNGKCDDDILKIIEIARGAFNSILKTITARHILVGKQDFPPHNLIIVWSTLLYRCETWTITTRNMTTLQSFERWAYRKMMKIYRREKKTNEEVLKMADEQLYIITTGSRSGAMEDHDTNQDGI